MGGMDRYEKIRSFIEPGERLEIWKNGTRVYLFGRSEWLSGPELSCVNVMINKDRSISKKGAKSSKTRG